MNIWFAPDRNVFDVDVDFIFLFGKAPAVTQELTGATMGTGLKRMWFSFHIFPYDSKLTFICFKWFSIFLYCYRFSMSCVKVFFILFILFVTIKSNEREAPP